MALNRLVTSMDDQGIVFLKHEPVSDLFFPIIRIHLLPLRR